MHSYYAVHPAASSSLCSFFFTDTATTEIYTLSLHDALPISVARLRGAGTGVSFPGTTDNETGSGGPVGVSRMSWALPAPGKIGRAHVELQSPVHLVCRLLLEKKKNINKHILIIYPNT